MANSDDVLKARMGDREALERLLIRHRRHLVQVARGQLGDGLRARMNLSDVIQSTFVDVVRSVRGFQGENEPTFVRWLETLLQRTIQDRGRFFGALKRAEGAPLGSGSSEPDEASLGRAAPSPGSVLAYREDVELVDRALVRLSEEFQRIIRLHVIEGCSHRQVAQEMGRSESGCRVLLTRARVALALECERLRLARASR